MKKKGTITYIYIALFLSTVLIILIGNSYVLIDRTRSNLIEIYWKQGELIVKSIAVSAHQSIDSVKPSQQQIKRHLKKMTSEIEMKESQLGEISAEELKTYLIAEDLVAITIVDGNDRTIVSAARDGEQVKTVSEATDSETFSFQSVRIERQNQPGYMLVTVGPDKLSFIKAQIGLQILIASLENRNIVQHISFIDDEFKIVADSDPFRIGISEEEIEYLDVLQSGVSYFFRDSNENVMKIIHPVELTPQKRGVLNITYPITRIDRIYANTFKSVVLNSSVVMLIAIIAAIVAVILNKRNLRKIESMEKQIRENEKMVSLANLTAGVAHEVRNPLNSVSITIQRLQLEFTPKEDNDLEEYAALTSLMKREVDRINLIITDFLDFAKPFEPKKNHFSINHFIDNSIAQIHAEAEKKSVSLITSVQEQPLSFFGDQQKLSQVLLNVMRNALEASGPHDTITIDSVVSRDQTSWLIQVKDNGVGISKQDLNHIFDMYFTTKTTGTGLGLYICRKIIHAHKGTIELSPNNGSGIIVSITLPFLDY